MRFKLFKFVNGLDFFYFMGESKKRHYCMTFNEKGKITGFKKFNKKENEGYFLQYDIEELKKCNCKLCQKLLKKNNLKEGLNN